MPKVEAIVFSLFLLGLVMPVHAEAGGAPGEGFSRLEIFRLQHLNMEENQEIVDFINACGISDFEEIRINRTHRYVYIIPKENCSNKLVFLQKSGEIIWVRQIGINETIPFKQAEPLDDFYSAHPAAKDNETIGCFVGAYAPERWKETRIDRNSSIVYLISGNETFRELMFMERDGRIVQIKIFDESAVSVNRTEALKITADITSSSTSPLDVLVVFSDSRMLWAVTYMDGFTVRTLFVDTETGKQDPSFSGLPDASERTGSVVSRLVPVQSVSYNGSFVPQTPGFSAGQVFALVSGVAFVFILRKRFKKN
jgi:hypothetical protein